MTFSNKVLSFEQGCEYLGYKKSSVYKMISNNILPYSKPRRKIFFEREALENWMLRNSSNGLSVNQKSV